MSLHKNRFSGNLVKCEVIKLSTISTPVYCIPLSLKKLVLGIQVKSPQPKSNTDLHSSVSSGRSSYPFPNISPNAIFIKSLLYGSS